MTGLYARCKTQLDLEIVIFKEIVGRLHYSLIICEKPCIQCSLKNSIERVYTRLFGSKKCILIF